MAFNTCSTMNSHDANQNQPRFLFSYGGERETSRWDYTFILVKTDCWLSCGTTKGIVNFIWRRERERERERDKIKLEWVTGSWVGGPRKDSWNGNRFMHLWIQWKRSLFICSQWRISLLGIYWTNLTTIHIKLYAPIKLHPLFL